MFTSPNPTIRCQPTAMEVDVEIKALAGPLRRADPVFGNWALGYVGHVPVLIGLPGDAVGDAQLYGEAALDALAETRLEARNYDARGTTCQRCPLVPVAEGRHRPPDSQA